MAELADALGSGSSGRKAVRVQIPPSAPRYTFSQFSVVVLSMLKGIITILFIFLSYFPLYAFDSELWPEEGKPAFFSKTNILILYEEPTTKSPVMNEFMTVKGDQIDFDMTRYRNIKPGITKIKKPATLTGKILVLFRIFPVQNIIPVKYHVRIIHSKKVIPSNIFNTGLRGVVS